MCVRVHTYKPAHRHYITYLTIYTEQRANKWVRIYLHIYTHIVRGVGVGVAAGMRAWVRGCVRTLGSIPLIILNKQHIQRISAHSPTHAFMYVAWIPLSLRWCTRPGQAVLLDFVFKFVLANSCVQLCIYLKVVIIFEKCIILWMHFYLFCIYEFELNVLIFRAFETILLL